MNSSHKISIDKLKIICKSKGLLPCKVIGTEKVQLSKGNNINLSIITWEEFEELLTKRNLAVYSQEGWIKIMVADLA